MPKKQTKWKSVLQNIKLVADTIGSLAPIVKLILVGLGTLCLTLLVGDFRNKTKADQLAADLRKHQQDVKVALALVKTTEKEVVVLKKQISDKEIQNTALSVQIVSATRHSSMVKKEADSLKKKLADTSETKTIRDSLGVLLTIVPKQEEIIKQQDSVLSLKDKKIDNLEQIIIKKDSINNKLTFALDSVKKVVINIPVADKCYDKILFCKIAKPSRKTSFVAGAVAGTILTAWVLK